MLRPTGHSVLFVMKNLALRRFSNFESGTVNDKGKLASAEEHCPIGHDQ